MSATGTHLFWIASRSAGIAAMLLASASVGLGLLMAARLVKVRPGVPPRDLKTAHEALSLATMTAIVVHAGALLGDSYLRPSLADVTIPFVGSYAPLWTSIGILSGWLLLALGLSYYARLRIGVQRWRRMHRWTAAVWVTALVHALGEGTDSGRVWFLAAVAIVAVPAAVLLALRFQPVTPKVSRQ